MNSKKRRAALIRERNRKEQEAEVKRLQANWERIQNSTGGFALANSTTVAKGRPEPLLLHSVEKRFPGRFVAKVPSTQQIPKRGLGSIKVKELPKYEGRMLEREQQAQEQTKLLKNRVAPIGNKMGPQYLNDSDLSDFEKGLLRRR